MLGAANNVNKQGFNFSDIVSSMGGFGSSGGAGGFGGSDLGGGNFGGGGGTRIGGGGGNVSNFGTGSSGNGIQQSISRESIIPINGVAR
jgi:hypothetical protein